MEEPYSRQRIRWKRCTVQQRDNHNIEERTTYYSSKKITEQIGIGQKFEEINQVIIIAILDYSFIELPEYITRTVRVANEQLDKEKALVENEKENLNLKLKEQDEIKNQMLEKLEKISGLSKKDAKDIFKNNIFAKKENGKWGYVDKNGNIVIDFKYEMTTNINEYGYGAIKENGKWGVIDSNGTIIKEPTYELESYQPNFIGEYYEISNIYQVSYYSNEIEIQE